MKKSSLSSSALKEAADCLRVISHPVRLEIIQLLLQRPQSVGEIAETCSIAHNVASTHLKTLERCRFLKSTRNGKSVFYHVIESHLEDLLRCIQKRFS